MQVQFRLVKGFSSVSYQRRANFLFMKLILQDKLEIFRSNSKIQPLSPSVLLRSFRSTLLEAKPQPVL